MRPPQVGLRRDENEVSVCSYLRASGYLVWQIQGVGIPDLLVWGRGFFSVIEVKGAKGKLTEAQRRWHAVFEGERAPVFTARSGEEAVRMIREYVPPKGPHDRLDLSDV